MEESSSHQNKQLVTVEDVLIPLTKLVTFS